ncbi:carbohydrate porin [Agaribacterium sp. ZY112]|uniref:carbohydrate porin n=1 Tax=Agaribacterium sp. ZY112 TaxID=3233574 RepID=UPI00352451BE
MKSSVFYRSFLSAAVVGTISSFAFAEQDAQFGSAEQVNNRINEDNKNTKRPFKDRMADKGLLLAADYSALAMGLDEALGDADDSASGGMFRFYGSWAAIDNGALVWKAEHRHSYTDTEPRFLPFNAGVLGLEAPVFSDQGTRLTNLYWKQRFNDGRSTVIAGMLDVTDYTDVYAVASPWTGFVNFAFSTGNITMALPNDAALGVAGATMLGDNFFIIGGVTDMESDPTKPLDGFDSFFNDGHYFKSVDLGWTSSQDNIFVDNVHVTLWDADKSETLGQAADSGVNLSASKMLGQWLPFVRASWADKGALLGFDKSVSTGFSYYGLGKEGNNLGLAINWADAKADSKQVTTELFYFMKLLPGWELTPDIQYVQNPVNSTEDSAIIAGVRTRLIW